MKTFSIILDTGNGRPICLENIERKNSSILDDAIRELESLKSKMPAPSDRLKEMLLPVCERLSKK